MDFTGAALLGRAKPSGTWLPATVTAVSVGSSLTVTLDGSATAVNATMGWDGALAVNDRVWCVRAGAKLLVIARQEFYGKGPIIGSGVPAAGLGQNGDFYLRTDGGVGSCIYQKRSGSWVATGA